MYMREADHQLVSLPVVLHLGQSSLKLTLCQFRTQPPAQHEREKAVRGRKREENLCAAGS